MKKKTIKIDKKSEMYVFVYEKYSSCLGFDVCIKRRDALALELGHPELTLAKRGTLKANKELNKLYAIAREKNKATGWRSSSELTPELIGLEGKRVEVVTSWGEKNRFIVGKSTGFIPCHLEIKTRRSSGGGSVCGSPFKSLRIIQ
jgi:hypothetical protein